MAHENHKQYVRRLQPSRGSVLIIALWSLLLLTTFAVQLGVIVRQKITLVHRLDDRDKRYRIAEAGVKYAISKLRKEDALYAADFLAEFWSDSRDLFENIRVGKGSFTVSFDYQDGESSRSFYGLQDEEGKINLNTADTDVIIGLLELAAGLSHSDAEEVAYNIVDWRDQDSFFQHPQYGAEDSDYTGRKDSYEAKDSDFEIIEELLLVDKMDQEIFEKIKGFITIYGEGKININTAPKTVLMASGLDKYIADNILLFRNGGDQIAGTGDDDIFIQPSAIVSRLSQSFNLSPSELGALSNLVAEEQFVTKSENFMIRCVAQLNYQKGQTAIVAVTDRTGQIKYWSEES
jgi:general secretion pathway protein K